MKESAAIVDTIPSTEDWRSPIRRRNGISASRVFPTRKNKGEGKKVVRNSAPYAQWPFHPASFPSLPFQEHSALPYRRGEIQIYAPTAPGVFFELMKNESSRQRSRLHPPSPNHPMLAGFLPPSASPRLSPLL